MLRPHPSPSFPGCSSCTDVPVVDAAVKAASQLDASMLHAGGIFPCSGVAGNRLILAPTGALTHDTDDVRAFADAAAAGVKRAVAAGTLGFSGLGVSCLTTLMGVDI
jgi:hypothetical protein